MILVNYHSLFASIVAELSDDLFTSEPCCVTTSTGNDTVNGMYVRTSTHSQDLCLLCMHHVKYMLTLYVQ